MSNRKNSRIESSRIKLQVDLDGQKTQEERNKLGQFATPAELARDVAAHGLALLPTSMPLRFLEPGGNTYSRYLRRWLRNRPGPSNTVSDRD